MKHRYSQEPENLHVPNEEDRKLVTLALRYLAHATDALTHSLAVCMFVGHLDTKKSCDLKANLFNEWADLLDAGRSLPEEVRPQVAEILTHVSDCLAKHLPRLQLYDVELACRLSNSLRRLRELAQVANPPEMEGRVIMRLQYPRPDPGART